MSSKRRRGNGPQAAGCSSPRRRPPDLNGEAIARPRLPGSHGAASAPCTRQRRTMVTRSQLLLQGAAAPEAPPAVQPPPPPAVQSAIHLDQHPSLPSRPLAVALSCSVCQDLLKEATTGVCGHTFCFDCVMAQLLLGGHHNVCPVPNCMEVLGPQPFDHGKLRYDFIMDGLVSKIFPRPSLDAALKRRREQREAARPLLPAAALVNGAHH